MKNKSKRIVNFPEFEALLKNSITFRKAWRFFNPFRKTRKKYLGWEDCERQTIERFQLAGRQLALFLGHSARWGGHNLL